MRAKSTWTVAALAVLMATAPGGAGAQNLPPGFSEETVFSGLTLPVAIRFAPDGRVFVAEKAGRVLVYEGLGDPTPSLVVDFGEQVNVDGDRGLLGFDLDREFDGDRPYFYVLYTYDAPPGMKAPFWNGGCPDPFFDGCLVTGRLSRFEVDADNQIVGGENVLIADQWCQQFNSHSIGTVEMGEDGALYVGGGDGASFLFVDYGQLGGPPGSETPVNACGDPPVAMGEPQSPPDAEGGALRSQDLWTSGDPVTYSGTILRVDPDTGAALPDNPLFGGAAADDDAVIAYGLRNPYRFTVRPGTREVWIGDVGWNEIEEIDVIADATDSVVENFGWPCYEGVGRQGGYDATDLALCEELYATPGAVTPPLFEYVHGFAPAPGLCGGGFGAAISGIEFYLGGDYPDAYDGAAFFTDSSYSCIYTMFPDAAGDPDPTNLADFVIGSPTPVDLEIGPDGDLFYVVHFVGEIRRVRFQRPTLSVTGSCPGTIDASAGGLPSGGRVVLLAGDELGTSTVPTGPCSGTALELTDPRVLRVQSIGAGGNELSVSIDLPAGACGQWLQLVTEDGCLTSEPVLLP